MRKTPRSEPGHAPPNTIARPADVSRLEDSALIQRVMAGQVELFGVLMKRYAPLVHGYLYGKAGSESDREDLFQETFLAAYSQLASLRRRDRFGPWLTKIARNKLVDHQRRQKVWQRIVSAPDPLTRTNIVPMSPQAAGSDTPMVKASHEQVQDVVKDAIGRTGDTYRTVLYMRLISKSSPQAIARQVGLKESTVRVRLLRGLKKLRKILQKQGITPPGIARDE